jgi:hypothetical protein
MGNWELYDLWRSRGGIRIEKNRLQWAGYVARTRRQQGIHTEFGEVIWKNINFEDGETDIS